MEHVRAQDMFFFYTFVKKPTIQNDNNRKHSKRIKYLRKDILHLTQIDFGKRIGIAGTTVTGWEKRNMNPSETALKTICYEFNVNYDWLVDGDGDIFIENNDSIELLKKIMI